VNFEGWLVKNSRKIFDCREKEEEDFLGFWVFVGLGLILVD
jgi:hypothetical protein